MDITKSERSYEASLYIKENIFNELSKLQRKLWDGTFINL